MPESYSIMDRMGDMEGGQDDGQNEPQKDMQTMQKMQPKDQPETKQKISRIVIDVNDDGSYKYTVSYQGYQQAPGTQEPGEQSEDFSEPKEVIDAVVDDLTSPHRRAPKGSFRELKNKLSHKKGVTNPAALAAYIKDKKYGKSWRND